VRSSTSRSSFCAIGSVKSNFGHLDAAAGIAGLIKAVRSLRHRARPPSLHYNSPNPRIEFSSSPFYVNSLLTPWEVEGGKPRRAGVSSFGIGGTNAHLVLEEAPEQYCEPSMRGCHLVVLSARSAAALDRMTENLRRHLEANPSLDLGDVAYTLQMGRREFAHRRAIVCRDTADAAAALADSSRWMTEEAGGVGHGAVGHGGVGHGAVLLYSGQGSQYAGMCRELYESEPVFRSTLDECADYLMGELGFDLREVLYPEAGYEEEADAKLRETEVTQPALFAVEYSLTVLWRRW